MVQVENFSQEYPVKGAMKFYFMHYLRVVIILFGMDLCKPAFSTYSVGKTRFSSVCFGFSCFYLFGFWFFLLCVLNSVSSQKT